MKIIHHNAKYKQIKMSSTDIYIYIYSVQNETRKSILNGNATEFSMFNLFKSDESENCNITMSNNGTVTAIKQYCCLLKKK